MNASNDVQHFFFFDFISNQSLQAIAHISVCVGLVCSLAHSLARSSALTLGICLFVITNRPIIILCHYCYSNRNSSGDEAIATQEQKNIHISVDMYEPITKTCVHWHANDSRYATLKFRHFDRVGVFPLVVSFQSLAICKQTQAKLAFDAVNHWNRSPTIAFYPHCFIGKTAPSYLNWSWNYIHSIYESRLVLLHASKSLAE